MKTRSFCWLVTSVAVLVTGWYHHRAGNVSSQFAVESLRLETEAVNIEREVLAAREASQAIGRVGVVAIASPASKAASRAAAPPAPPKPVAARISPEVQALQVRAFVSEQRLLFAATLKRLALDASKLEEFDRIQGEYQQTLLDGPANGVSREVAGQTREARLRELFGADFGQWTEANRSEPARAIVAEIVARTFQSSGALTTTQADELTRIVRAHRVPPDKTAGASQSRYDWEAIVTDASGVLASRQLNDFAAAIRLRRASDEMAALAAAKK